MSQYGMAKVENYHKNDSLSYNEILSLSSEDYYSHVYNLAQDVIRSKDYHNPETGYISDLTWKKLVDGGMLATALGERGQQNQQEEKMQLLRILSYSDISLGLSYGITIALVIDTLQRLGSVEQQEKYLGLIRNGHRMALAITEKNGSGSTALDLKDSKYTLNADGTLNLTYLKHLQGLTGDALIVLAEKENVSTKTLALILVDAKDNVATTTPMMGLKGLRYGINQNRQNLVLNTKDSLMKEMTKRNIRDFESVFARSRFGFIGMTLGYQEMVEQLVSERASNWEINGSLQINMDDPKQEIRRIRARRIATETLFNFAIQNVHLLEDDPKKLVVVANLLKAFSSECALTSARVRSKLLGGRSLYAKSALQDEIDIWSFTVFEGVEPMHYTQIGQAYCKGVLELKNYNYATDESIGLLNKIMDSPKNLVHLKILGQIVSRLFILENIDEGVLAPDELEDVFVLLNLEIQQLGLEYFSVKI